MRNSKSAGGGGGVGSSSARKSRWGPDQPSPRRRPSPAAPSSNPPRPSSPAAVPRPFSDRPGGPPIADPGLPPPQTPYGFHCLERRTIVLADGSVRSYFALPPDYERRSMGPDPALVRHLADGPPPSGLPHYGYPPSLPFDSFSRGPLPLPEAGGPSSSSIKRKYEEDNEHARHRHPHLLQSGSGDSDMQLPKMVKLERDGYDYPPPPWRDRHQDDRVPAVVSDVDPEALKKAFLGFVRAINEHPMERKNYLEDGRNGPLRCLVCGRASKDFSDVHGLIMHAYNSQNSDLRVDHLGLHKALCVLMGWNYAKVPDNSKAYQSLSADDAAEIREDLIIWPPMVIIHNTSSGRKKDGRMEGMGNREMDTKLKELGFGGGKSKSMYGKEGHLGVTVVKFGNTQAGLKEAERLAEFFEKDDHGRRGWAHVQASILGDDDKENPMLVKVDAVTGEKKRILYGYLATASDLEKVDFDTRKKAIIKTKRGINI